MLFYLPFAFLRGKLHRGIFVRLGFLPSGARFNRPIWLHAVSVGEILAARPLLEELRKRYPEKQIVISTVTTTGNELARGIAARGDYVFYLPFDLSFIVKKFITLIKPVLFLSVETEIWPNLISYLYQNKVVVAIVNARISPGSYRGYRCVYYLIRGILRKISLFCVQTESDAERFVRLGAPREKIKVTGNMKFDIQPRQTDLRLSDLGLNENDKLIVAGSTHSGEEEIILRVFRSLRKVMPLVKLLIAPRHPERAKEVERLALEKGLKPCFISRLGTDATASAGAEVFILDTIGQLACLYSLATVVFVGGSLVKKGGHNIIEPAQFAKPIIIGPHTYNFRQITEYFFRQEAVAVVKNEEELEESLRILLENDARRKSLSRNAYEIISLHRGAAEKNAELLAAFL